LLVSEQLYFNDVEVNEVKTTTQEEILRFLFCEKKKSKQCPIWRSAVGRLLVGRSIVCCVDQLSSLRLCWASPDPPMYKVRWCEAPHDGFHFSHTYKPKQYYHFV